MLSADLVRGLLAGQKRALFSAKHDAVDSQSTDAASKPQKSPDDKNCELDADDVSSINETRIAEIMEYYSQYEKELLDGGYTDNDDMWLRDSGKPEKYPVSLDRGVEGVFDAHEIVEVLKEQKMSDVCCIELPKEVDFARHMVIGTAFSLKHISSTASYVSRLYKKKRSQRDPMGIMKSPKGQNWTALDLGNIALHLMMPDVRQMYDIEMLWTVGPRFDQMTIEKSETEQLEREFEEFRRQIETQRQAQHEQQQQ